MRIISGQYKGNLVSFQADHIRPTTDRVKESMFNILQNQVDGAVILDLFSGTGNLGLEALSRGARSAVFVEKNRKSIDILKKNLEKLKVTEPYQIIQKDVLQYLKQEKDNQFDLIFVDPPFTEMMGDEVLQAADVSHVWKEHTVLLIESARREKISDSYSRIERYDSREFGDKTLSFFRLKSQV